MIALALLLPLFAGWMVVESFSVSRKLYLFERLAYGFLAGQVLLSWLFLVMSLLFKTASPVVLGGLLLALGLGLWISNRSKAQDPIVQRGQNHKPGYLAHTLLFLLILTLSVVFIKTIFVPITAYDGFAIYAPKSFAIFTHGAITPEMLEYDLPHPDYPLLIPISEAWNAMVPGQWHEGAVKVIFPMFLTAAAFIVAGYIGRRYSMAVGWGAAILLVSTPQVFKMGHSAICDFPLGVFILAAVAILSELQWESHSGSVINTSASSYLLPGLFLVGAGSTKNEGLPLALIVLFVTVMFRLWVARGQGSPVRSRLLHSAWAWLILVAGLLPWWLYKTVMGLGSEMINQRTLSITWLIDHLERIPFLFRYFYYEMIYSTWHSHHWGEWLIGWICFWIAIGLWLGYDRKSASGFPGTVALLQIMMFFLIFTITPYDVTYQLKTALDRLLVQIYPTAFLFTIHVFAGVLSRACEEK